MITQQTTEKKVYELIFSDKYDLAKKILIVKKK